MEKRGVIEPSRTPPEHEKQGVSRLEDHPTTRAAAAVAEQQRQQEKKQADG